uniref:DUF3987 domain-containing protein n=1 Tax=Panagrellus redivivus TaxID=6233 RepID=A0A7E4WB38_PANRE
MANLFERFMNENLSTADEPVPERRETAPVAPPLSFYEPSELGDRTDSFEHARLDDDYDISSSDHYEFHYGSERPIVRSGNSRVTIRTLANALSTPQRPVRESDIFVFCDGRPVPDNTFTPGKRYFIHFTNQAMPTPPEIDDRRFIVKTDIDQIYLSDLPVSLIAVARVCHYLGNSGVARYSVEPKDGTSPLIFGKSLAASFQQVALKLSAAFVAFETSEIVQPNSKTEQELVEILRNVLAGLNEEQRPDFELIRTATAAQIKHAHRNNVPKRDIVREVIRESNIKSINEWRLIENARDAKTSLTKAYQPFDSVVLPLLKYARDLVANFTDEALIELLDVLIEIVYAVNTYFENFTSFYYKLSTFNRPNEEPKISNATVNSVYEQFKSCYGLFRAIAPYGFVNEAVTFTELQKILEKAQLHYAISNSKMH